MLGIISILILLFVSVFSLTLHFIQIKKRQLHYRRSYYRRKRRKKNGQLQVKIPEIIDRKNLKTTSTPK